MVHFNNFSCMCRVVSKPQSTTFSDGKRGVVNFRVVIDCLKDEQLWLDAKYYGIVKRLEILMNSNPGQSLILTGRLEPETYKEKQKLVLNAYDFQFVASGTRPDIKSDNGKVNEKTNVQTKNVTKNAVKSVIKSTVTQNIPTEEMSYSGPDDTPELPPEDPKDIPF